MKLTKYGITSYILCESKSGYCQDMKPYDGETSRTNGIVMEQLGDELVNKGHTLYMDNYYNSIRLTHALLAQRAHTVGTLRKGRGAPSIINDLEEKQLKK